MKKINIKHEFSDDWITRRAGEKLRNLILKTADKAEQIEIDFCGLVIASTSFFDEGFAKLIKEGWTKERISSDISLKNINPKDREILDKMIENREFYC